ncbi:PREDICTED: probable BOI-related E3 ubiquitin-protein ligase 2 isoform X2 [Lupinus angustifolius]|uniref:probable BOI-related E3 ubiquitin-protein ligase 2 isoform X2 n=1 Tax=Lupinus angustifolius TaxID=3871 RepID=UPI00092F85AD|nr:PREDICTED: probable BOI-related E3 ubiquitin-protein ligase 2 isoform X2 [Lupinus angustifolius]
MAIQTQFYHTNGGSSPFCDNGFYASGFTDSCFNPQQIQHLQQLQQLHQCSQQSYNESHNNLVDPNLLVYNSKALNPPKSFFQLEDIDQYIRLQNEKLRFVLQELVKQQASELQNRVESHSLKLLKQKDEEIAKATKKRVELEDFIIRLETENQGWEKMAQENEATALSLYKTLEEMKEKAYDAESWCDERRRDKEEGIVRGNRTRVEMEQITKEMMVCKSCNSERSCFLFLPCRHLCSCKTCDAFLKDCPVCTMPKKASIETLI